MSCVWIVNFFASDLSSGFGGRWYYLAKELAKLGYDVHLISSADHHLLQNPPVYEGRFLHRRVDGFNYIWIKTGRYASAHSRRRILSELRFSSVLSDMDSANDGRRPDYIICSTPSLISGLGALSLSRRLSAKFILDVRDLWPLTLIKMGYSKYHPFIIFLNCLERYLYSRADFVFTNWPYAINYMRSRHVQDSKYCWIPNGFCFEEFSQAEKFELTGKLGELSGKFIVGYAGTIGKANALHILIRAAKKLKNNPSIAMVIAGDGRERDEMERLVNAYNLSNVFFVGPVKKKYIPGLLATFDVCYVGFLDSDLYVYGSSLTKLPEYMASGKPIVYASNSTFQPVKRANCGITVPAEDSSAIAEAVIELYQMSRQERTKLGENGIKAAREGYDYGCLAKVVADCFLKLR